MSPQVDSADWTIKREVQDAIAKFASTLYVQKELEREVGEFENNAEGCADALSEFDLKGSWLKYGDGFRLISQHSWAEKQLENAEEEARQKVKLMKEQIKGIEAENKSHKQTIEAALGDKVYLNVEA